MASAKGFDFIFLPAMVGLAFFMDCRNKQERNIRCSYFKFACELQHCLQQEVLANNAAVAVVTSIQLGINQFILKPITNEVN
jgi:hypothetical protein